MMLPDEREGFGKKVLAIVLLIDAAMIGGLYYGFTTYHGPAYIVQSSICAPSYCALNSTAAAGDLVVLVITSRPSTPMTFSSSAPLTWHEEITAAVGENLTAIFTAVVPSPTRVSVTAGEGACINALFEIGGVRT